MSRWFEIQWFWFGNIFVTIVVKVWDFYFIVVCKILYAGGFELQNWLLNAWQKVVFGIKYSPVILAKNLNTVLNHQKFLFLIIHSKFFLREKKFSREFFIVNAAEDSEFLKLFINYLLVPQIHLIKGFSLDEIVHLLHNAFEIFDFHFLFLGILKLNELYLDPAKYVFKVIKLSIFIKIWMQSIRVVTLNIVDLHLLL